MDIKVYLPDDIGEQAKEQAINLSRLLRDAVEQELERRKAVQAAIDTPQAFEIDLEDKDGHFYKGRITGAVIASDGGDVTVYLTDDERVLVHDVGRLDYYEVQDPESELEGLPHGLYFEALTALGIQPVIDL
jgi:post-segregation antitoxin (ccd killing protein)